MGQKKEPKTAAKWNSEAGIAETVKMIQSYHGIASLGFAHEDLVRQIRAELIKQLVSALKKGLLNDNKLKDILSTFYVDPPTVRNYIDGSKTWIFQVADAVAEAERQEILKILQS